MIAGHAADSLTGLMRRAKDEIAELIRLEIESARVEVATKVKRLSFGVAAFAVALALGAFAIVALTAAAILGLSTVVAPWLAAVIVALIYVLGAAICALVGRSLLARAVPPLPVSSLHRMKEDARWISKRASSAKA